MTSPTRSVSKIQLSWGIGAELAIELVEQSAADVPLDRALRLSYAKLKTLIPIANDKTSEVQGVTIVSGAPGSGKTTTLVKLAAEHVKNVGNNFQDDFKSYENVKEVRWFVKQKPRLLKNFQ